MLEGYDMLAKGSPTPLGTLAILPPEIRYMIWFEVGPRLEKDTLKWLDWKALQTHRVRWRPFLRPVSRRDTGFLALLRASSALYAEITGCLYEGKTLEVTVDSWPVWTVQPRWLATRRRDRLTFFNHLEDSRMETTTTTTTTRPLLEGSGTDSLRFWWLGRVKHIVVNIEPPTLAVTDEDDLGRDVEVLHMARKIRDLVRVLDRESCIAELTINVIDGEGYATWFEEVAPENQIEFEGNMAVEGDKFRDKLLSTITSEDGHFSDLELMLCPFKRLRGVGQAHLNLPERTISRHEQGWNRPELLTFQLRLPRHQSMHDAVQEYEKMVELCQREEEKIVLKIRTDECKRSSG